MANPLPFSSGDVLTAADMNDIGTWTNYTPTITSVTGSITSYTVNFAHYVQINKLVIVEMDIKITNAGTGAIMLATLPVPPVSASGTGYVYGRENAVVGYSLNGRFQSGTPIRLLVHTYNNGNPVVTNYQNLVTCIYEAA